MWAENTWDTHMHYQMQMKLWVYRLLNTYTFWIHFKQDEEKML